MGAADRFDISIFPMQAYMHFKRGDEAHDRRAAYDEISRAHGTKVDDVWARLQEVYDEEGLTLTQDGKVGNPFDAQRLLWFAEKQKQRWMCWKRSSRPATPRASLCLTLRCSMIAPSRPVSLPVKGTTTWRASSCLRAEGRTSRYNWANVLQEG